MLILEWEAFFLTFPFFFSVFFFLTKFQEGLCVSLTEERLPSGHTAIKPDQWSVALIDVLLKASPMSKHVLWCPARVIIVFLVTSLTKDFPSRLPSLAKRPALVRVLVVPNFFWLRIMEATVETAGPPVQQNFCSLQQICTLTQSRLSAVLAVCSTSWLHFCSDMCYQLWDI